MAAVDESDESKTVISIKSPFASDQDQSHVPFTGLSSQQESSSSASCSQCKNDNKWLKEDAKKLDESGKGAYKQRSHDGTRRILKARRRQISGPSQPGTNQVTKLPENSSPSVPRNQLNDDKSSMKVESPIWVDDDEYYSLDDSGTDDSGNYWDEDYDYDVYEEGFNYGYEYDDFLSYRYWDDFDSAIESFAELTMENLRNRVKELEERNECLVNVKYDVIEEAATCYVDNRKFRASLGIRDPELPVVEALANSALSRQRGEIADKDRVISDKEKTIVELQELVESQATTLQQLTEKVSSTEKKLHEIRCLRKDLATV